MLDEVSINETVPLLARGDHRIHFQVGKFGSKDRFELGREDRHNPRPRAAGELQAEPGGETADAILLLDRLVDANPASYTPTIENTGTVCSSGWQTEMNTPLKRLRQFMRCGWVSREKSAGQNEARPYNCWFSSHGGHT